MSASEQSGLTTEEAELTEPILRSPENTRPV